MKLNISSSGVGQPLIFLHGFGFNKLCFKPIINQLSSKYQCIAIDLPGFGASAYEPYDLDSLLIELHSILPLELSLLGWSLGGTIALAYAKKYPYAVNKLILVATNPQFLGSTNWPGMNKLQFKIFYNLCKKNLDKAISTFLMLQFPHQEIDKNVLLSLKALSTNKFLTTKAAHNALNILTHKYLRQAYAELLMPVLNILGQKDQLVPVELERYLTATTGIREFEIFENCSHIPFITQELKFIKIVDDFLC